MDNFFPFIGDADDYKIEVDNKLPELKELAWDFKNDDYIITDNGEFKIVKEKEALKVWVYMCLKTSRYEHIIYSEDYGTELMDLVGQKFTKGLTESEGFRYVKEALEINPYINNIKNNGVYFNGDTVNINIIIDSVYGEVNMVVRE